MANHKRGRPKHQRAGCLMCKPHKDERGKQEQKASIRRQLDGTERWLETLSDEVKREMVEDNTNNIDNQIEWLENKNER